MCVPSLPRLGTGARAAGRLRSLSCSAGSRPHAPAPHACWCAGGGEQPRGAPLPWRPCGSRAGGAPPPRASPPARPPFLLGARATAGHLFAPDATPLPLPTGPPWQHVLPWCRPCQAPSCPPRLLLHPSAPPPLLAPAATRIVGGATCAGLRGGRGGGRSRVRQPMRQPLAAMKACTTTPRPPVAQRCPPILRCAAASARTTLPTVPDPTRGARRERRAPRAGDRNRFDGACSCREAACERPAVSIWPGGASWPSPEGTSASSWLAAGVVTTPLPMLVRPSTCRLVCLCAWRPHPLHLTPPLDSFESKTVAPAPSGETGLIAARGPKTSPSGRGGTPKL
jgi:hypothetical protein